VLVRYLRLRSGGGAATEEAGRDHSGTEFVGGKPPIAVAVPQECAIVGPRRRARAAHVADVGVALEHEHLRVAHRHRPVEPFAGTVLGTARPDALFAQQREVAREERLGDWRLEDQVLDVGGGIGHLERGEN